MLTSQDHSPSSVIYIPKPLELSGGIYHRCKHNRLLLLHLNGIDIFTIYIFLILILASEPL